MSGACFYKVMHDFEAAWKTFYPESPPIGWVLKHNEHRRWLRFHSLPQSKRYASDAAEAQIILARQNTVAIEVLGKNAPCWLVAWLYCAEPKSRVIGSVLSAMPGDDGGRQPTTNLTAQYQPEWVCLVPFDEAEYDIYAARCVWNSGAFDPILSAIADDECRLLWMSEATGAIFAPYDGGMDLILPDPSEIARLRSTYADWLSARSDGM